jgi:hypothetical protein
MTTSVTLHLRCIASPPAHGGCAHAPTVQYTSPRSRLRIGDLGPDPLALHTRVRLLYPPCSSGAAPRPAVPKGGNPRGSAEGTGPVRLRASSCFTPIRKLRVGAGARGTRGSTFEVNVSIDVRLTFRLFTRSGKVSLTLTVGAALDTRQTGPVPGVRTRRPDPGEIKLYPDRRPEDHRTRKITNL